MGRRIPYSLLTFHRVSEGTFGVKNPMEKWVIFIKGIAWSEEARQTVLWRASAEKQLYGIYDLALRSLMAQ